MEKMLNAKKIDVKTIALVVVSVLLVVSLTLAGTMAWFTANDSATNSEIVMGQALSISIDETGAETGKFDIEVSGTQLLPGSLIAPLMKINFAQSTTAAVLRVKITVSGGEDVSNEFSDQIQSIAESNGWFYSDPAGDPAGDGYYYYFGIAGAAGTYIMYNTAESTTPVSGVTFVESGSATSELGAVYTAAIDRTVSASSILGSVYAPNVGGVSIVFSDPASDYFRLPETWTDEVAQQTLTITFEVEAVQDFIIVSGAAAAPTIANTQSAFAQASL